MLEDLGKTVVSIYALDPRKSISPRGAVDSDRRTNSTFATAERCRRQPAGGAVDRGPLHNSRYAVSHLVFSVSMTNVFIYSNRMLRVFQSVIVQGEPSVEAVLLRSQCVRESELPTSRQWFVYNPAFARLTRLIKRV